MHFFCGRQPVSFPRSRKRLRPCLALPWFLLSVCADAQHIVPLTLAEAEDTALANEPGRSAFLARADALVQRSVAVGELPDPSLRVGLNNYPFESGGFSTEGMTHALVAVRQDFPPGKTRALSTRQYSLLADEMSANAEARARDVLAAARTAWLDAHYWQHAKTLVTGSRPFFDDLAAVTRSLYSVGRKNQQDVLRAELELSRLDDRLIEIDRQLARAHAALGQWLGRDAMRPMASGLPRWDRVPTIEVLRDALLSHPVLEAADARVAAEEAGVALADESYKPGWSLDLGYSYRDGVLPDGSPRSDFVSLSVTVDLPFFQENRQDRSMAAALSERRAANDAREQLIRRLGSQLDAEHSRWQDLSRRLSLYETRILVQTSDQARAALVAYQSESGDFADVMRGFIDDLNARLDHRRLQIERAQSYAILANLGGLPR